MLPDWVKRLGPLATRLVIGHFASYPPAFVWIVALMPAVILSFSPAELGVMPEKVAAQTITYRALAWGGVVFVVGHFLSIPWAIAKTDETVKKRQRTFFASVVGLLFLGVLVGAVGWAYIIFFLK